MKTKNYLFLLCTVALVTACASSGVNRADRETMININYATVSNVEAVKFKSDVGKSAAVGGLWGLALNAGHGGQGAAAGAAAGALFMGLTTKITEGSRDGFAYTMTRKDQSVFKVVTDNKHVKVGDCVAVESGKTTNIRAVSPAMCEPKTNHPIEAQLRGKHLQDATECHAAKQELLKASTDSQVDAAMKKVKVLCH